MKNKYTSLIILMLCFVGITLISMYLVPGLPNTKILMKFRFNKLLSLFLVGALTGVGSFITQLLTKNKKADVSTLGIGAFNIFGTILVVLVASAETLIIAKDNKFIAIIFASSFVATICLWFLTKFLLRNTNNLLIMGLILTLFTSALGYLIIDKLKVHEQQEVASYLIGSILINKQEFNIQQLLGIIALAITTLWLFVFGNKFLISVDNEEKAKSLGLKVNVHKFSGILCIAATAAASFLIAGNIMFIGFAIGNINYLIFKKNIKFSAIGIVLIGGTLTIGAYYIFNRILEYKTYEGIYIMITSGVILIITTIIERSLSWMKK